MNFRKVILALLRPSVEIIKVTSIDLSQGNQGSMILLGASPVDSSIADGDAGSRCGFRPPSQQISHKGINPSEEFSVSQT